MASPLETLIKNLLHDIFGGGNADHQPILDAIAALDAKVTILQASVTSTNAGVSSIQNFLGDPGGGATQDQLDALGQRVTNQTGVINQFDTSVQEPPPPGG